MFVFLSVISSRTINEINPFFFLPWHSSIVCIYFLFASSYYSRCDFFFFSTITATVFHFGITYAHEWQQETNGRADKLIAKRKRVNKIAIRRFILCCCCFFFYFLKVSVHWDCSLCDHDGTTNTLNCINL